MLQDLKFGFRSLRSTPGFTAVALVILTLGIGATTAIYSVVDAIALRYATVYGERQHYRGVNALYIIQNYDKIMRGERPVLPGDGSEVHDYIHVADVARANVMAMASEVTGEVFNVVTGVETTVKRIAEIVLDVTGSDLTPEYADDGSCRGPKTLK